VESVEVEVEVVWKRSSRAHSFCILPMQFTHLQLPQPLTSVGVLEHADASPQIIACAAVSGSAWMP
jgi:hypothetical protein